MATTDTTTMLNGVDIPQLQKTVGAIEDDPSLAEFRFRARNQWEHGGHSRTEIRSFYGAGQIEVRSLDFELEGQMDLRGFLGLSDDVRPGYSDIRLRYTVDCNADDETVDDLCAYVQRTSPVMDILRNPVNVEVRRG